jgi:hypothetical protein
MGFPLAGSRDGSIHYRRYETHVRPHHGSPCEGGALYDKKITQKIPDGTLVAAGAVVISEEDVRALKEG